MELDARAGEESARTLGTITGRSLLKKQTHRTGLRKGASTKTVLCAASKCHLAVLPQELGARSPPSARTVLSHKQQAQQLVLSCAFDAVPSCHDTATVLYNRWILENVAHT